MGLLLHKDINNSNTGRRHMGNSYTMNWPLGEIGIHICLTSLDYMIVLKYRRNRIQFKYKSVPSQFPSFAHFIKHSTWTRRMMIIITNLCLDKFHIPQMKCISPTSQPGRISIIPIPINSNVWNRNLICTLNRSCNIQKPSFVHSHHHRLTSHHNHHQLQPQIVSGHRFRIDIVVGHRILGEKRTPPPLPQFPHCISFEVIHECPTTHIKIHTHPVGSADE